MLKIHNYGADYGLGSKEPGIYAHSRVGETFTCVAVTWLLGYHRKKKRTTGKPNILLRHTSTYRLLATESALRLICSFW